MDYKCKVELLYLKKKNMCIIERKWKDKINNYVVGQLVAP